MFHAVSQSCPSFFCNCPSFVPHAICQTRRRSSVKVVCSTWRGGQQCACGFSSSYTTFGGVQTQSWNSPASALAYPDRLNLCCQSTIPPVVCLLDRVVKWLKQSFTRSAGYSCSPRPFLSLLLPRNPTSRPDPSGCPAQSQPPA